MKIKFVDFKFLSVAFVCFLLSSCVSYKPFTKDYYENGKKVGVLVVVHDIGMKAKTSYGSGRMSIAPRKKYREALNVVQEKIDKQKDIQERFETILKYTYKNKEYLVLPDTINIENFDNLKRKDKKKGLRYFQKDFRSLKNSYDVDEILFVDVNYGMFLQQSGLLIADKNCYCEIFTRLISVEDNQLYYYHWTYEDYDIFGKWNAPPDYSGLTKAVSRAIHSAVSSERRKLVSTEQKPY